LVSVKQSKAMEGYPMPSELVAVDLFSGAGGISLGLEAAGYRVLLGNDLDEASALTYRRNFPNHPFLLADVRSLSGRQVMKAAGLRRGELDLLVGGPPCQGFSILGSRIVFDPRNDLFREFMRLGADMQPRCMVMENVPGLATLAGGRVLGHVLDGFASIGYSVGFAELLAAQYGVPQMRWRMIFVAFRRDLKLAPTLGFPRPTHGRRGIGELVPNCTVTQEEARGFLTARDAIGDLPLVAAGEQNDLYTGRPSCAYQRRARASCAPTELHNHYAPRLSPQNLVRIRALKAGQDWRDLPRALLPEGMKRAKRKDHTRRYSRMTWDGVPRSIITRFRDPKSGEYTHPSQHRTISIREAARIQSFPDHFAFEGTHTEQYDQVGNAVPPLLAEAFAREVASCLRGDPTFALESPFSRRKRLAQTAMFFLDEEPTSRIKVG
jgi:DNA (cytosine-5)-methyltransferase 1